MAMSQYSYGKLQVTRLKRRNIAFPGGFDADGNLTAEPGPIENHAHSTDGMLERFRALP